MKNKSRHFKLKTLENGVAIIGLDYENKSVNILSAEVLAEFKKIVGIVLQDQNVKATVLVSLKNNPSSFIAGADIKEILSTADREKCEKWLEEIHYLLIAIENSPKPFVVAIEGACLGGGFELALACHARVASDHPKTVFGLPEVNLGIIPGFGGTQRLPRLIKLSEAIGIIASGKNVYPYKASKLGIIDDLVGHIPVEDRTIENIDHEIFVSVAINKALSLASGKQAKKSPNKQNYFIKKIIFAIAKRKILKATKGHYPAPIRAIEAIKEGLGKRPPERAYFESEMPRVSELAISPLSKKLINIFFWTEKAKSQIKPITKIDPKDFHLGVLGAGLMGSQIAAEFSEKGFETEIKDISEGIICSGMTRIRNETAKDLSRRLINQPEAEQRILRIHPTIKMTDLRHTCLVIEAIAEVLPWKQDLFLELEKITSSNTIFATNTSSFTVAEVFEKVAKKERCLALHYFNPVKKMKLLEIGVADFTSKDTIEKAFALAKMLGKIPIVVKDCPGFLVNRILSRYLVEAMMLLAEGASITTIDSVAKRFGMAIDSGRTMGPFELLDYVGIVTGIHVLESLKKLGPRIESPSFIGDLIEDKKNPLTFWEKGKVNQKIYQILESKHNWIPKYIPDDEIEKRLFYPMVDEAIRCLHEEIVAEPWQIDLAMILGVGFPAFRGGLTTWAKEVGLDNIFGELERMSAKYGSGLKPCDNFQKN